MQQVGRLPLTPKYYSPAQQSGQPGTQAYEAPLCGRPEPLGATRDAVWPSPPAAVGLTGTVQRRRLRTLPALQTGVNFALLGGDATAAELCLFTEGDLAEGRVSFAIPLDPAANRSGDIWHVHLPGVDPGLLYGAALRPPAPCQPWTPQQRMTRPTAAGYRLDGPHQHTDPGAAGHRFDPARSLPYICRPCRALL